MKGGVDKFPIKYTYKETIRTGNEIRTIREERILETSDDLINLISSKIDEPTSQKKKLTEIFQETGIENTMLILDHRTIQIFENFLFYEDNPSKAFDNKVWFDSVIILKPLFKMRLF